MTYPAVAMTAFGLTSLAAVTPRGESVGSARTFGNAQTALVEPGQAAVPESSAPATLEEQISKAEKGIVRERIWIYRNGSGGRRPLASTRSDSHGHFVVHLTNREYTAVMQAKGCPLIYIFEITYEGVEKELRFRLNQAPKT
jgi:hypothetical protein